MNDRFGRTWKERRVVYFKVSAESTEESHGLESKLPNRELKPGSPHTTQECLHSTATFDKLMEWSHIFLVSGQVNPTGGTWTAGCPPVGFVRFFETMFRFAKLCANDFLLFNQATELDAY
jgi:hypothetical protein